MALALIRTGVTGPEPVSVADMKNWLKVPATVTSDDGDIASLIRAARQQAERISNCALVRSTFAQYHDHFPGWRMGYGASWDGAGVMTGPGLRSGYGDGMNLSHHPLEIKLKRPPLVSVQKLIFIGSDGRPYTLNPGQDFIVDTASQPGRIRPTPFTVWPLTLPAVPNAVGIFFTAGYAPAASGVTDGQTAIAEPETSTPALNPTWQPNVQFAQYAYQTDLNGNIWIQTVNPSGTTGSARPNFEAGAIGATIPGDGSASWMNVGPIRGNWSPGTVYKGQNQVVILDYNSNLQLLQVAQLISQTIPPYSENPVGVEPLPWGTSLGQLTEDNGVAGAWLCLGTYTAVGNQGLITPNAPEQQAAYTQDYTLLEEVPRFIKSLVTHWYYNREPVTADKPSEVPFHMMQMLGSVTVEDYAPTP